MQLQYVMVFFIITEARKSMNKKSETEVELTVPPDERYYRVPFGAITLEGFNPLSKGPLEYENFAEDFFKLFRSTEKPEVIPFVPNKDKDIKSRRNKWKRSKRIKKKRDQGSKTFGRSPDHANEPSPQGGDELPEGPDENDGEQPKAGMKYATARGGMYIDFTRNFMSSIGHRYRDGNSFAHGSPPEQASTKSPEPEIPHHMIEDKYYPERRVAEPPQYPSFTYEPPYQRNRFMEDNGLNWTTCEEFGRDAEFYPRDIVNIEWIPFFVWTDRQNMIESIVHTFEYPTIKLVQKYRKMASPLLRKKLDWEAPKLMMKEHTPDSEFLIIAADRKGKFDGLVYLELPEGVKDLKYAMPYPVVSLHLKSLGSYLALMSCNDKYAVIMAPSGSEPKTFDAARRGASFLKFNGTGFFVKRNLLREQMIRQTQRDMEAKRLAQDEALKRIPPGPQHAYFPFNRVPQVDFL